MHDTQAYRDEQTYKHIYTNKETDRHFIDEVCDRMQQVICAKLMRYAIALAVPVCTLFWSIFIHFVAIHPWSVHRSRKSQKKSL